MARNVCLLPTGWVILSSFDTPPTCANWNFLETWSYTGVLSTYIQHESNLEKSCVLKGVGLVLPGLPGTQSLRFVADIIFCNYHTSFFTSTRNNEGVQHSPFSSYSLQPQTMDTQWGLKPKNIWNVWAKLGRQSSSGHSYDFEYYKEGTLSWDI